MTGCIEEAAFESIMRNYIMESVTAVAAAPRDPAAMTELAALLDEVRRGPLRGKPGMEWRMVSTIEPKGGHRRLAEGSPEWR
ncbi:Hypothetical protein A7982_02153 [Minicystis rosea]|nr:Hypothetical protein A7982_02153 [Minicystis rosea]